MMDSTGMDIRTTYLRHLIDYPPGNIPAVASLVMLHLAAAADDGEPGLTREQIERRVNRPRAIVDAVTALLINAQHARRVEPGLIRLAIADEPSASFLAGIASGSHPTSGPLMEGHQAVKKTALASKSVKGGRS